MPRPPPSDDNGEVKKKVVSEKPCRSRRGEGVDYGHATSRLFDKWKVNNLISGVNFIPVLPYISDTEEALDTMIGVAKEYGADFILVGGLTLFGDGPNDCKTLYYRFLDEHFPELVPKYRSLYRIFPYPDKAYSAKLAKRASLLCQKHGIRNSVIESNG